MAEAGGARLSAPVYFMSVLLLTLAGVRAAMLARPVFGHAVLQGAGLVRRQPRRGTHRKRRQR